MDFSGLTITGGMVITPQARWAVAVHGHSTAGTSPTYGSVANITPFDSAGVVQAEYNNATASPRHGAACSSYGGDKGLMYSGVSSSLIVLTYNLINNTGSVFGDSTFTTATKYYECGAGYGIDKGLIIGGYNPGVINGAYVNAATVKISNVGVPSSNTSTLTTARAQAAAATYGVQNIIVYGGVSSSITGINAPEWFDNNGTSVAYTYTAQGSGKYGLGGADYGYDKAIFGLGLIGSSYLSWYNRVNNVGYVDVDVVFAGTGRMAPFAMGYGIDLCMFVGGYTSTVASANRTLINNLGNFVSDAALTGFTARSSGAGTHL